jgi:signal transduction histidine kinase
MKQEVKKMAIISGSGRGIGKETTIILAKKSVNVLFALGVEMKLILQQKLNKEKFNINEKIRNVIKDIKSKENEIEITFVEPKVDPIVVEADKTRIYEVISNLLVNAVKFTQKRSGSSDHGNSLGEGNITVFTSIKTNHRYEKGSGNREVIISIRDRGAGIDPDIQDRLFSKFVTKSETGIGLGLFISKGIIEAHDGRIWAENNADGKGATFYFSLPLTNI